MPSWKKYVAGLGALLSVASCGDIKVASGGGDTGATTGCKVDGDCNSGDTCRTGSCQSGQCTFTVQANSCFAGNACYAAGQELAGDRCQTCSPGEGFVRRSCAAGSACDSSSGQCVAESDGSDATDGTESGDLTDGVDATDGVEGTDTTDATDGTDAQDGTDGETDADGTDATDSTDSTDATDGTDATDTTDGTDSTDDGPLTCALTADCAALKTPCETAICVNDVCVVAPLDPGTPCVPADVPFPSCWSGTCADGGVCNAAPKASGICDDGVICTVNDACSNGLCAGQNKSCGDGNPCTADLCDSVTGTCSNFPLDGQACSDDNPCTEGDVCAQDSCTSGQNLCSCTVDADCTDDGNLCNGTPVCQDGGAGKVCVIPPASIVTCDPGSDTACSKSVCVPATGVCQPQILAGTPCSDGSACTQNDQCSANGACTGTAIVCQDENPCTDDTCDAGACKFTNNTVSCNDDDGCTTGDKCDGGTCGGADKVCNDGNPCTTDSCVSGECVFTIAAGTTCTDGDICTSADACDASGVCRGSPITCNDNNLCTTDTCTGTAPPGYDPLVPTSACVFTNNTAPCNDNNVCTTGDLCQAGACKPGTAVVCPAGGACQVATCNPVSGCTLGNANNGTACNDGSACTTSESCTNGVCGGGTQVCECAVDADCADGNLCNGVEKCVTQGGSKKCQAGTAVACSPSGNTCQANTCQPATGTCLLVPANENASCGSDDICTTAKVCKSGACTGTPVTCPSKVCQVNAGCDLITGCKYTNATINTVCDDGSKCTDSDKCDGAGKCGGKTVTCNDSNPCTADSCAPATGCIATPLATGTSCDTDSSLCTIESCVNGACKLDKTLTCDDGIPCTLDACRAATGQCEFTADNFACDDKSACTSDTCVVGAGCVYGAEPDFIGCDDQNPSTSPDLCINTKCVGGTRFDPFAALGKGLCDSTDLEPVSATTQSGAHVFLANFMGRVRNVTTLQCATIATEHFRVFVVEPGGTISNIGGLTGWADVVNGPIVAGEGAVVGLISDDLQNLKFSDTELHTAIAVATTQYKDIDWRAIGSTFAGGLFYAEDYYLLGGRNTSTLKGFALQCILKTDYFNGTKKWSCSSTKLPITPPSGEQDWRGASLWSVVEPCTTQPCFYNAVIDGGILVSRSTDQNLDVSIDAEGDNTFPTAQTTFTGDAAIFNGIVQVDSTQAWIYGAKGLMARCSKSSCKDYAPLGTGTTFYDAVAIGGSLVALAQDEKGWMLTGFQAGSNGEEGNAWFRFDLPVDTEIPMVLTGSLATGITVVGTTKDQSSYVLWRFVP